MPLRGFLASEVASGLVMVRREPAAVPRAGMPAVWAAVAGHHLGTLIPLKFLRYCTGEVTAEVIGMMKVKDRVCKTSELSETLVTLTLTFH
jgi:hypothetical protein